MHQPNIQVFRAAEPRGATGLRKFRRHLRHLPETPGDRPETNPGDRRRLAETSGDFVNVRVTHGPEPLAVAFRADKLMGCGSIRIPLQL
jgi:hypothetical protein